jgi:hypothetical protein
VCDPQANLQQRLFPPLTPHGRRRRQSIRHGS